jgi:hypothetical protein
MSSQIAFFLCEVNDICHARQGNCLLSSPLISPRDDRRGLLKGQGIFIYSENIDNIRKTIGLFSARCLPKPTWINDSDVFLERMANNMVAFLLLESNDVYLAPNKGLNNE